MKIENNISNFNRSEYKKKGNFNTNQNYGMSYEERLKLDKEIKDKERRKNENDGKTKFLEVSFSKPTDILNFSKPSEKEKNKIAENEKSGKIIKDFVSVTEKFEGDAMKLSFIEEYTTTSDLNFENRKEIEKKFLPNYKILEEYYDEKTHVKAMVLGNKKTKEVEIVFAGSGDFSDKETWINNIDTVLTGKNSSQDVALAFAKKIKAKYENGFEVEGETFKKLTKVNGHSKGGGEALYCVSHIPELSAFTVDPLNVTKLGPLSLSGRSVAVVPNNGDSTLNNIIRTKGGIAVLSPKLGGSQERYNEIIAFPVSSVRKNEKVSEKELNDEYEKNKVRIAQTKSGMKSINRYHTVDNTTVENELALYKQKSDAIIAINNTNDKTETIEESAYIRIKNEERNASNPKIEKITSNVTKTKGLSLR